MFPKELEHVGVLDVGEHPLEDEVGVEAEGSDVVDYVDWGLEELPPVGTRYESDKENQLIISPYAVTEKICIVWEMSLCS